MHLAAGLVLVIAYLALSINSYLETQALGRFSLGYGRLGPTEARLALIALLSRGRARRRGVGARADAARRRRARCGAAVMVLALAARAVGNLRVLAAREPYTVP